MDLGDKVSKSRMKKSLHDIKCISFGGAGWKMFYYYGIFKYLFTFHREYLRSVKVGGASVGAWVALGVILEKDPDEITQQWCQYIKNQRKRYNFLYTGESCQHYWDNFVYPLIENNQQLMNEIHNRWFVSVSYVFPNYYTPVTGCIKQQLTSVDEVYRNLFASGYIPGLTAYVKVSDLCLSHIDGGVTNNQPTIEDSKYTLYISSNKNSNADIKPSINFSSLNTVILPDIKLRELMYKTGYDDAMNYFTIPSKL